MNVRVMGKMPLSVMQFLLAGLLACAWISTGLSQQVTTEGEQTSENPAAGNPGNKNSINADDAQQPIQIDGLSIRRIYFYGEQAPKLLTPGFWPVSIQELEDALRQRIVAPEKIESRPYLASAVYVAKYQRGAFVSDASTLDITYRDDQPAILNLGSVNLALESQSSGQGRRLVTGSDGILRAIVDQDSRMRFSWSRRGVQMPEGWLDFDLQIPACGRTRFIIGMPKDTKLEARDGVMFNLPSLPPEIQTSYNDGSLTWYSIEAGGLTNVRLSVLDKSQARPSQSTFVLRRLTGTYSLSLGGLTWTARSVVDVPQGADLPRIIVGDGGRISSVRVDGVSVKWQESTLAEDSSTEIALLADDKKFLAEENFASNTVSKNAEFSRVIEISGTVPIDELMQQASDKTISTTAFNVALPWLRFDAARTTVALPECEISLSVSPELRLCEVGSSRGWRVANERPQADGVVETSNPTVRRYQIFGNPTQLPPKLRFIETQLVGQSIATFRLAVVDKGLRANWEAAIELSDEGPRPIDFQIQPGWQVDSVAIRSSGRVVDLRDEDSSKFTLWPEPGDVVDGVIRLQITGSRALVEGGSVDFIPKSWFVRQTQTISKCFAAVVPPTEYEWVPGTALEGEIISSSELPSLAAEMIGPIVGETLLFLTNNGETPELRLAQPPAAFNSEMHLKLTVEEGQLVERLRIDFKVPAGRVPSVQVQLGMANFGQSGSRPPMRWRVLDDAAPGDGVGPIAANLTNVKSESLKAQLIAEESDNRGDQATAMNEVWELTPEGGIRDGLSLYGERRYKLAQPESGSPASSETAEPEVPEDVQNLVVGFPLPSLPITPSPQGTIHRATVIIGRGIDLLNTTGEVSRIPRNADDVDPFDSLFGVNQSVGKLQFEQDATWALRYDPSDLAGVTIRPRSIRNGAVVVWEQLVDILAGSAGDQICATFKVESPVAVGIRFDDGMSLTEIDGQLLQAPDSEPRRVVIAPRPGENSFRVFFWRPRLDRSLMRAAIPPSISVEGVVIHRACNFWPTRDAIALIAGQTSAPPEWMAGEARGVRSVLSSNDKILIVPISVGWGAASALALIMFAMGWLLANRSPNLILLSLVAFGLVAFISPVWTTALLGFAVVPLASAGLLNSALHRLEVERASSGNTRRGYRSARDGEQVDPLAPTETHKPNNVEFPIGENSSNASHRRRTTGGLPNQNFAEDRRTDSESTLESTTDELDKSPSSRHGGQSSVSRNPWTGFFTIVLITTFGLAILPQVSIKANDELGKQESPIPVMIPVQKDGQLFGDRVYVPKTLIDLLFRPKSLEEQLGRLEFQSADYDVRITSSGMRDVGDSVTIDAIWRVEIETASKLVRLPIDPADLDRFEIIVDSVPNEVRPEEDGKSILVRLPKAGVNILRGTMTPQVDATLSGTGRVDVPIPAVANSSITITPDTVLDQIGLPRSLGQVSRSESGTRVTASMGPVDRLEIVWQRRGVVSESSASTIKRRWWVTASESVVSRELELEIGATLRSGVVLEVNTETSAIPYLTTRDWAFAPNENQDSVRGRLRFLSTVNAPGPLRLLWTDARGNAGDAETILPDVRPVGQSGPIETLVAVDLPREWQLASIQTSLTGEESVDALSDSSETDNDRDNPKGDQTTENEAQPVPDGNVSSDFTVIEPSEFAATWTGYRGSIELARRHLNPGTIALRFSPAIASQWTANVAHQVVVNDSHLKVDYTAVIAAAARADRLLTIALPPRMNIEALEINGRSVPAVISMPVAESEFLDRSPSTDPFAQANEPGQELLLPSLPTNAMSEIRIRGSVPFLEGRRFSIPRLRIIGLEVTDDQYIMSRVEGLRIREQKEPASIVAGDLVVEYDLMKGTVPLRSWKFTDIGVLTGLDIYGESSIQNAAVTQSEPGSSSKELRVGNRKAWDGGRFRVTDVNEQFSATTLTTLSWNDGVWSMNATLEVENFVGLNDFLTFRIPSRWIEGLDVKPAVKWSSQPSTDGESHLIRVLPATNPTNNLLSTGIPGEATGVPGTTANSKSLRLTVTSRLESSSDGGVSVPQISVLGGGVRKNYFAVPKRLTTSPIIWQLQNARQENEVGPLMDVLPSDESHTAYQALGNNFSASLQPAPITGDSARCPLVDISFFSNESLATKKVGLMRVLFSPGNRNELLLHVPSDVTLLGIWGAGMPVGYDRLSEVQLAERLSGLPGADAELLANEYRDGTCIRIPLVLSRLADQLVVLFQVQSGREHGRISMPKMIDMAVEATWIATLEPTIDSRPVGPPDVAEKDLVSLVRGWLLNGSEVTQVNNDHLAAAQEQYRNDVATAVTELLSASIDSAAERSAAEKRAWLRPWFLCLRSLGWEYSPAKSRGETSSAELASEQSFNLELSEFEKTLDVWAPKFLQRVFGAETSDLFLNDTRLSGNWISPPIGWRASSMTRLADTDQTSLTPVHTDRDAIENPFFLSEFLGNWSFYIRVCGLLCLFALTWWLGGKLARSPSLWLMILGIASVGLIPFPITVAIFLLSLLGPFVPVPKPA